MIDFECVPVAGQNEPDVRIRFTPREIHYISAVNYLGTSLIHNPDVLAKMMISDPTIRDCIKSLIVLEDVPETYNLKMLQILHTITSGNKGC